MNFVAADERLLFRTAQGAKLAELTVNSQIAFETDGVGRDEAWSVVVKGTARVLEMRSEIDAANELSVSSVYPAYQHVYVEITPLEITGRRFHFG